MISSATKLENPSDTYYSQLWGPDRPEKRRKIPVEGRRKNKETCAPNAGGFSALICYRRLSLAHNRFN